MKALSKHWHQDKDGAVALLILIAFVLLYLTAMFLWIRYQITRPVIDWRVHDIVGNALGYKLGRKLYKKIFERNRG